MLQLYADQLLIADEFLRGEPWTVSLRRLRPYLAEERQLRIKCSPLSPEADVYLERPVGRDGVRLELLGVTLIGLDRLTD